MKTRIAVWLAPVTGLFLLYTANAPEALAQSQSTSQLNSAIQSESNALGGIIKDLGPAIEGDIASVAKQLGDPHLGKELQMLPGSRAPGLGTSTVSQISALSGQISHIPGFANISAALQSALSGTDSTRAFTTPTVKGKLLPRYRSGANSAINNSTLDNLLSQALSPSASSSSSAINSELQEASHVMPAAVQNMEQENQEINQLLKE
jgi:hypothetical protein